MGKYNSVNILRVWLISMLVCSLTTVLGQSRNQQDSLKELKAFTFVIRAPIAKDFSIQKMSKMDIYLNPNAAADPLKAIAFSPSSTSIDESANPSLRGGTSGSSRVYLNGAPIVNPVRFAANNGLGSFSLFNTALIENQYLYPSNPPLTMGNTSAGVLEIETIKDLKKRDEVLEGNLSLVQTGLIWSKKLAKSTFMQLYGNYQYDKLFLAINQEGQEDLKAFSTKDIGLNLNIKIKENLIFNSFNYFINEGYDFTVRQLNAIDNLQLTKNRFFSVNNLDYIYKKTRFRVVSMFNIDDGDFVSEGFNSNSLNKEFFNSLGVKTEFNKKLMVQYGLESSIYRNDSKSEVPIYWFNPLAGDKVPVQTYIDFYYVEPYLYLTYDWSKKVSFSSSVRKNIFYHEASKSFLSYQLSSSYRPFKRHGFILSGGKYHSYTIPNYYVSNYTLLSSHQLALDYTFTGQKITTSAAVYFKNDQGAIIRNEYESYDEVETFGVEVNVIFPLADKLEMNLSNIYLHQQQHRNNIASNTALNLKYFVRAQLSYNNYNLFNSSLSFSTRPGNHYTKVTDGVYSPDIKGYIPQFGDLFDATLQDYYRVDWTISKLIPFKEFYVIAYATVNNVFDAKNQLSSYYNMDYSQEFFTHMQRRTFFIGFNIAL